MTRYYKFKYLLSFLFRLYLQPLSSPDSGINTAILMFPTTWQDSVTGQSAR